MAVKKSTQQVIRETRQLVLDFATRYLERLSNGETIEKEEKKHLKEMKSELKFVEGLQEKLNGKSGSELKKGQEDILKSLKNVQSSIGDIVKSIPKN